MCVEVIQGDPVLVAPCACGELLAVPVAPADAEAPVDAEELAEGEDEAEPEEDEEADDVASDPCDCVESDDADEPSPVVF